MVNASDHQSISVVVPVYNSEETLSELTARIIEVLGPRNAPYEIVLVNDGSKDGSWETIKRLSAENPQVRGVSMARNFGQHNALLAGIRCASYEITVTMDDDLQNPPEMIELLVDELARGNDVVYGTPDKEHYPRLRGWLTGVVKRIITRVIGLESMKDISSFRAFHTSIRDVFSEFAGSFVDIDVLLSWGASTFAAVPVQHDARETGESNYNFRKLLRHTFDLVASYSVLPLQFASLIGIVFTLLGICIFLYAVVRFFVASHLPGFTFLASMIAIFSGSQLLVLGIFGEYLGRIHFRVLEKPTYVVRDICPPADIVRSA